MKIHVLKRLLRSYHKYLGFLFSFFILYLTVTGIMLLYPDRLGVRSTYIDSDFFLEHYGMSTANDVFTVSEETEESVFIDKNVYFNEKFIDTVENEILTVFFFKDILYVFMEKSFKKYVFENIDNSYELADILSYPLSKNINAAGMQKESILVKSEDRIFKLLNSGNLQEANSSTSIRWKNKIQSETNIAEKYLKLHQGDGVSLHRIITEFHNGKFFGSGLIFILFLSSITILFLVISSFVFGLNLKFKRK